MASNIDPSQPTTLHPKFSKLRANFAAAKAEIEALQTTVINPAVQQALDLKVDAGWLPGAPSNLPAPNGIQIVDNSNGTRDITLRWAAYEQGSLHANYLLVYVKEITTPGDSITSDDSSLLVSIKDRYITFKAFNPAATYRFGIAAVRSIEHNVDVSAIVQPTSAPDWLVEGGVVNFTGNIGGTAAQTVAYNASTALSNAAAAQAAAAALNQDIADMSSEDQNGNAFLTPAEKVTLRRDWDAIADEKSLIDAQAATYGLTTRRTNYLNAFTALADYLNGGTTWASGWPLWINDANMSVKTAIVRNVIRGHFKTYNSAKVALLQKVADEAKAVADTAATAATAAASAASAAQVAAAAANSDLYDIAKDNVLSKLEKKRVILDYNAILDEKADIDAKAVDMGLGSNALKIAYDDAIAHATTGLTAYLATLTTPTAWNDLSDLTGGKTTIDGPTFRAKFKAVYTARQALLNAITAEAAKRAVWATGISGVPANLIALTGTEPIKNALITINANGTLSGGGAGQVTLDGLGATAFASLAKITAANVDTFLGLNAINSTHIASLTADKIAAGTLAAGVVYAGTINSNQIVAANLAAITADLGTVTAGHITGSAGIDISGTANFTGTVSDSGSGVVETSTVRGWAAGSTNLSHGILGRADGAGYGLYGANWTNNGGGGVRGVSRATALSSTLNGGGAGVHARNTVGGTALYVDGIMEVTSGVMVTNLNAHMLAGHLYTYFAPAATTLAGYNIANAYTKTETDARIQAVVGAAPAAIDTLVELAAALGNDANFSSTVNTALGNRVIKNADIVAGTHPKISFDAKGLVVGGAALTAADIPNLDWSKITTGIPNTLAGFGLSDNAYNKSEINSLLSGKQDADADLTAIAALAGTGILKRTAANTWALDTSTFLTGNQAISVTGDATGSGSTGIVLTLATVTTAGTYPKITFNAKGLVTGGAALLAADIPGLDWSKITTGKPTTLAGYGITSANIVTTLGAGSITTNELAANSVGTAELAAGAVTSAKVSTDVVTATAAAGQIQIGSNQAQAFTPNGRTLNIIIGTTTYKLQLGG